MAHGHMEPWWDMDQKTAMADSTNIEDQNGMHCYENAVAYEAHPHLDRRLPLR